MEKLSINKESVLAAHLNTDSSGKELLEHLFGSNVFEFNYRTIDSYEAACKRNGEEPITDWGGRPKDEKAYIKLKSIAKAINNDPGFPRFTVDEYRYFPWFYLYTKEEYDKMDDEQKNQVVWRSYNDAYTNDGVAYAQAYYAASYTNTLIASRLAFKERERAIFCGKTFIDLWADYVFLTE